MIDMADGRARRGPLRLVLAIVIALAATQPAFAQSPEPQGSHTPPETEAPETEAPESDAPETETPETEAPETEAPETEAPTPPAAGPEEAPESGASDSDLDAELEALRAEAAAAAGQPDATPVAQSAPQSTATTRFLNALNPQITVFGDLVFDADPETIGRQLPSEATHDPTAPPGAVDDTEAEAPVNRVSLRSVEMDLRAAVDPYAKAVVILGLEEVAPQEYEVGVEEGYLTFTRLPGRTLLRIGRFLTPFGQLNRLHLHDLPMPRLPLPSSTLLGEEGDRALGIEASWLLPVSEHHTASARLALVNAESPHLFTRPGGVAWLARVSDFVDLTAVSFLELGASYLAGFDGNDPNAYAQMVGADLLLKVRPDTQSELTSLVLQAEGFFSCRDRPDAAASDLGGFAMLLYQLDLNWYLGARVEALAALEPVRGPLQWRTGATLSFYTTEFLRFRLNYDFEHADDDAHLVTAQVTFVFGTHPAEPYWFNR